MMKTEIRSFDFEIRAEQNEEHGHFLAGQPIVYNEWTDLGWYDEMIDEGALDAADLRDRFLVSFLQNVPEQHSAQAARHDGGCVDERSQSDHVYIISLLFSPYGGPAAAATFYRSAPKSRLPAPASAPR